MDSIPSQSISTDYVYLCGQLVPNTELLLAADTPFHAGTRMITEEAVKSLKKQGVFMVGNMRGVGSGGERAYFNGSYTARQIAASIR